MPPPSNSSALRLIVLLNPFFVVKLKPGQEIAPCVIKDLTDGKGGFFSVTRTPEEVSLVGEAYKLMPSSYNEHSTWTCIKILGPMEHSMLYFLLDYSPSCSLGTRFNRRYGCVNCPTEVGKSTCICVVHVVRSTIPFFTEGLF